MKIAFVSRVVTHYRLPVLRRIAVSDNVTVRVFHGTGIPNSKIQNARNLEGIDHVMMRTYCSGLRSSGRAASIYINPSLYFHLRRFRPDVIVAEGGSNVVNNVFVFLYKYLNHCPVVWWTLGDLPGRQFSGLGRLYRRLVHLLESKADALIGYSSNSIAYFQRMGYEASRCFLAVNTVDTDAVAASAVSSRTRRCEVKELLNARDARIVLFVGELAPEKSIDRLLRAFVNVRRMHHNVICVVVGDGQERRHLEQLSYELGVSDGVRFVGRVVEGISDYFEAADVFVLPGLGGLGISEALAHGLPVLCSGGDGTEIDLVVDGKTGRRVDPNLSEGEIINLYSETLLEWLGDDKLLQCLAEGAYDHAHKQFSFSKFIDKIMEAIRYAVRLPQ